MNIKYIVIRRESRLYEKRVILIPSDCKKIINIIIFVERNNNRCFKDDEYYQNGCILIDNYIDLHLPKNNTIIFGLKELDDNDKIYSYNHLYFSHTFKNQIGSDIILNKFKKYGGCIYDLEYFVENNKRLFAFGYYAGIVGCYLGLLQYYTKLEHNVNIVNIRPFSSYDLLFNHINCISLKYYLYPQIAIIGNGRCAQGCIKLLKQLNLPFTIFDRHSNKDNLIMYTIILNCILLDTDIEPFITLDKISKFTELKVVVDISCDYNNINNPLPIYTKLTDFMNPVESIDTIDSIDIIAIDNLPTLLPIDSSIEFSNKLINIIDNDHYWKKVKKIYSHVLLNGKKSV